MSGGWLKETRGTGERATVIIASCSTIIPFSYAPRAQLPDETESTRMNCLVLACARNYARVITRVRLRRARLPSVIVRLTSSPDSHCQPACLISVNHSRYAALLSTFKRRYENVDLCKIRVELWEHVRITRLKFFGSRYVLVEIAVWTTIWLTLERWNARE